ncbi:ATP-binding protein [Desulfohalobium retbaense]|uniref:AAA ATPase n=1 Tax=Desulfohalobium retbaense (strain ATCC 49708 / DSM 5692 / JCM 16813 / HR100) TaxID=485915 RepID=C8X1M0_DESRD|nr:ATP-binding protein [Desulfohalobium retbaense]ACV68442.1 AAA ATPase [Desulfohalobium retbaense DSM 5692]
MAEYEKHEIGAAEQSERLGQQLMQNQLVTEEQLQQALKRQQLSGGRLGHNLVALGYVREADLADFFKRIPPVPNTEEDTGLGLPFIVDLINKHIAFMGEFTIPMVADRVKLPISIVDKAIEVLRRDKLIEVKGASQLAKTSYKFSLTDAGRNKASELLNICRYAGPAPVTLAEYRQQIEIQTVMHIVITPEQFHNAFSHLVINDSLLKVLGPAACSGRATFLYGPPGNGKTTIAEAMGKTLPGEIYVPHALVVNGEIITVYDKSVHEPVSKTESSPGHDQRWVCVQRPTIMTGGELTMRTLDLDFNPISKFYEAPLQLKANNGLFLVDDLGRQEMNVETLLNRWIIPLARRTDLLTLHTGRKFEIPFDQVVIFATNLDPKELVDMAFLRRLRYKIKVDHPTPEEYRKIFIKICKANNVEFKEDVFEYLMDQYYQRMDVRLSSCQPRDIIDLIVDDAFYHGHHPEMTTERIDMAWDNLFVK